jgi:radical SAM superfamily enzyme YgiQ (UPF0313 family)
VNHTDIILCTLNSTYQHSSFGLRYLLANLGPFKERCQILESTIKENPRNLVEKILSFNPKIVGFSLYIWNTSETLEVIMVLKKVSPDIIVVLGGPEISYETETQPHLNWADYVIKGEADFAFRELCSHLLEKTDLNISLKKAASGTIILSPSLPDIKKIEMPYDLYNESDIQNRVIYVEASRGCPYKCEYCLSSLDKSVRNFDLEQFLSEMKKLLDRGVRTFKFVDRTFNLSPTTSTRILEFFLEQVHLGLFLHFEMVPDRLPVEIKELIKKFPQGSLQFEIGIQTLSPEVAANVSRKNDMAKVEENFKFLKSETQVHTHADLIVGLPGETLSAFAKGFDELHRMGPDEIQVGILKRLKGTPIARHEKSFKMQYSELPPYQILSTDSISYLEMQKMNRFAKFWELYANSGEFKKFINWLCQHESVETSFFSRFMNFTEFLSNQHSDTHSISLLKLAESAYLFMISMGVNQTDAADLIVQDYCFGSKRRDLPNFLKHENKQSPRNERASLNQRQLKHLN